MSSNALDFLRFHFSSQVNVSNNLPPSQSRQSDFEPQFLVIGAGSRGTAYAQAVDKATPGRIAAVAEPDAFKRADFGRKYIWKDAKPAAGQTFADWREFLAWETERRAKNYNSDDDGVTPNITGVFICTLDQTHAEIICALAPLSLHVLCEKPLALTLSDCLSISRSLSKYPAKVVSIGHVLRYSQHNMLLRKLLVEDQKIGEIVSIEHTEPVGYWHFAHSYVRGNWRRSHQGVGSLLTKSCHDIDFILWLLCSPSSLTGDRPHLPATITSHGSLTHFRQKKKPHKAGAATNCLSCPAERDCIYSAKRIYRDKFLRQEQDTGWPVKIVVPEIEDIVDASGWEAGEQRLMQALAEDYDAKTTPDKTVKNRAWYGRCVYEADNDVVDEQTVVITWDEEPIHPQFAGPDDVYGRGPKHAIFHMTYPTQSQCERRGRIYGSLGEITYDSHSISVHTFADRETRVHDIPEQDPEIEKSHGGGDWGLAGAFVDAVVAVETREMSVAEAQRVHVGCDLEEVIRSHAAVFCAEEARAAKQVIRWKDWWGKRVGQHSLTA